MVVHVHHQILHPAHGPGALEEGEVNGDDDELVRVLVNFLGDVRPANGVVRVG